ncbi:MAG: hypothetical protein PVJ63_08225 [Thioalkalispiraceae bacterium]|jgi:hypothetical protein
MTTENDPIVDNWYFHKDKGQRFMVVSVDQDSELVEIQNFDGNLEEVGFSDWYQMDIELSVEPENWSGATDVGEVDDYGTEVTDTSPEEWDEPLQEIRSPGSND